MSDLRTAAQQALEYLDAPSAKLWPAGTQHRIITALRAVLAESERDWSLLEATQESLRDHMEEIHRLRGEMAAPVQEQPTCDECGRSKRDGWALYCVDCLEPVFAQRKPLAEWQINDLMANIDPEDVCSWSFRQGVYAAEKHHGIGEP